MGMRHRSSGSQPGKKILLPSLFVCSFIYLFSLRNALHIGVEAHGLILHLNQARLLQRCWERLPRFTVPNQQRPSGGAHGALVHCNMDSAADKTFLCREICTLKLSRNGFNCLPFIPGVFNMMSFIFTQAAYSELPDWWNDRAHMVLF